MMKHFDKSGYLMSGGTPGQDMWSEAVAEPEKNQGLIAGHAYTII